MRGVLDQVWNQMVVRAVLVVWPSQVPAEHIVAAGRSDAGRLSGPCFHGDASGEGLWRRRTRLGRIPMIKTYENNGEVAPIRAGVPFL